ELGVLEPRPIAIRLGLELGERAHLGGSDARIRHARDRCNVVALLRALAAASDGDDSEGQKRELPHPVSHGVAQAPSPEEPRLAVVCRNGWANGDTSATPTLAAENTAHCLGFSSPPGLGSRQLWRDPRMGIAPQPAI